MHDMTKRDAMCALTRYEVIPVKGENIQESIPGVSRFQTDGLKGESGMFAMLGTCGWQTDYVFGFVSSFWAIFMYKVFSSRLRIILY